MNQRKSREIKKILSSFKDSAAYTQTLRKLKREYKATPHNKKAAFLEKSKLMFNYSK